MISTPLHAKRRRRGAACCAPTSRLTLHVALIFTLLIVSIGCNSASTWQRIQEDGVLRIGIDPSYPPFENIEGHNLAGIDVDVANALAAELGLTAEFDLISYDGLYDALLTERVDVLLSALIIDERRTAEFAYSEPYFNAGQMLVVPQNSPIQQPTDLNEVAVELGAEGHVLATQLEGVEIVLGDSAESALNLTVTQQTPATITDHVSARLFIAQHDALKIAPIPLTVEPYALVVRIGDQKLLDQLNNALETLQNTNQLNTITSEWLDSSR